MNLVIVNYIMQGHKHDAAHCQKRQTIRSYTL